MAAGQLATPPDVGGVGDAHDAPAHAGGLRRLKARQLQLPASFSTGPGALAARRFALGQAALGVGGGVDAAMRAWYRRFWWAQLRREHGLLGAALRAAREPVVVAREVRRTVARHGPACERLFGVPVDVQRRQALWLALARGIAPDSYYLFQLFRPERRARAARYLQQREAALLYRVLAYRDAVDDYLLLEDKRRFEQWCVAHALPTVRTLAEFADGARTTGRGPQGEAPEGAFGRELFSKPADANKGAGGRRWRWDGTAAWLDAGGQAFAWAALEAELAKQSCGQVVLLQECLANDPALAPVAGRALCTVRLLTARPPGGAPDITHAAFRTGVGDASTDNVSTGGIGAAVDVATGRLTTAVCAHAGAVIIPVDCHPDTGVALAGFQLPHWDAAIALVLRAHRHLPAIGFVGWDVALTPDGPVFVEGNFSPAARIAQSPSGTPLGDTKHLHYLDAHLRHTYRRGARPRSAGGTA